MKSPSTSTRKLFPLPKDGEGSRERSLNSSLPLVGRAREGGFTLIEALIVLGIFAIIAAQGLLFSMDFYRAHLARSERDLIVSMLQSARMKSINNINQLPHGVRLEANQYILFGGTPSSTDAQIFEATGSVSHSPLQGEIVFDQLTGMVQAPFDITVTNAQYSYIISVNNEGRINWEN